MDIYICTHRHEQSLDPFVAHRVIMYVTYDVQFLLGVFEAGECVKVSGGRRVSPQ